MKKYIKPALVVESAKLLGFVCVVVTASQFGDSGGLSDGDPTNIEVNSKRGLFWDDSEDEDY